MVSERIDQLKDLFPEAVTEGRIDLDKLKAALGEIVDDRSERYAFTWAGKRDAVRLLQTPSRATLKPCPEESLDWKSTQNLFIEGENLEVLKLLYKSYAGRVKMIYIDPPYNTGHDFIYPDNFADPLENYLKLTGQKNAEGNLLTSNPETSGRYHSAWLSMMYPRLFVARQLLREDGVIFLSIGDVEAANLRKLCDEIFGEENFVANVVWQKKYAGSSDDPGIAEMHDHILVYQRSAVFSRLLLPRTEKQLDRYKNPDDDPRGPWSSDNYVSNKSRTERPTLWYPIIHPKTGREVWPDENAVWRYSREKHQQMVDEDRLYWGPNEAYEKPRLKRFLSEIPSGIVPYTWWPFTDVGHNDEAQKETAALIGKKVFNTPKPVRLINRMLTIGASENEIVLDFFAGSCVTAQGVLESNIANNTDLQFVMIQLPEPCDEKTVAYHAGLKSIAEIGKERIRRTVKKIKEEAEKGQQDIFKDPDKSEDLGFRVFKLSESNYRQWRGVEERDGEKYAEEMALFSDPLMPGWKPEDVLWEVALKEGYSLSAAVEEFQVQDANRVWRVADPDKDQSFLICLDREIKTEAINALQLRKDGLFVCRDAALTDEQAANLALTCKLKTI